MSCYMRCDDDCEWGIHHCGNVHLPSHKRTHDPRECPEGAAMIAYYDRDGTPIGLLTWGKKFGDFPNRVVRRDEVGGLIEVMTMFHGMDGEDPWRQPPHIFGTVIKLVGMITEEVTSPTEEAALQAHEELLRMAGSMQ